MNRIACERNRSWPDRNDIPALTWEDLGKLRNRPTSVSLTMTWRRLHSLRTGLPNFETCQQLRTFSETSRSPVRSTQLLTHWVPETFSKGVKRPWHKKSPRSSAEVRNGRSCNSTAPNVLMACTGTTVRLPFMQQKFEPVISSTVVYSLTVIPTPSGSVL